MAPSTNAGRSSGEAYSICNLRIFAGIRNFKNILLAVRRAQLKVLIALAQQLFYRDLKVVMHADEPDRPAITEVRLISGDHGQWIGVVHSVFCLWIR